MSRQTTLSCSVTGYRKSSLGRPCEDATRVLHTRGGTILAVADGHGDARCIYADIGAALAVRAAADVLKGMLAEMGGALPADFWNSRRRMVAEEIVRAFSLYAVLDFSVRCPTGITADEVEELREHILALYRTRGEVLSPDEMRARYALRHRREERLARILYLYGTTVRASVFAETYMFNLALGDGDTVAVIDGRVEWLLPPASAYATETASLCGRSDSVVEEFDFSYVDVRRSEAADRPSLTDISVADPVLLVSTDGLRNSFFSDTAFCQKVLAMAETARTQGARTMSRRLRRLYEKLSRASVYQDDISSVMAVMPPTDLSH